MNRFNLTFWGEILPGKDPEQVKARFARLFDITDAERLEHFFTGETITLRRNLDRKVAGEYYHKLHKLGVEAELVKVTAETTMPATGPTDDGAESDWEIARRQAEQEALQRRNKEAEQRRQAQELARQQEADKAAQEKAAAAEARRVQEERAAQQRIEAEHASKRAAAEAASKAAAELEARQLREQEVARLKALAEEERRVEEAARLKAEQEAEKQRKAEEAARRKAEQEAEDKRKAEEAAQRKAEQEAERKRKAEEAAQRKAEQEAERKRKAEEAAQRKAQQKAERKRKAEEAARRKAEQEAERKRKAEEAAQRKAEQEAERKRKAEEAAQRKAEQEAERKRKAEEAARLRAEREAEKQRKAEAIAAKKAAAAEARRLKQEEAARKKAEAEEKRRQAAEEAAKRKALEDQQRRQQQAEAARIAGEKAERERQKAAAEAQDRARQAAEKKRQLEIERAQKAEARRKQREAEQAELARQEEARRREAREAEQRARELEEKAIERGAKALTDAGAIKVTPARVKSRLELPRNTTAYHSGRARQSPDAPNLYRLRPFRNTGEVRERPAIAGEKMRKGLLWGAAAFALLLILLGRYVSLAPPQSVSGPQAVAASQSGQLLILAGEKLLLHDRAGVSDETISAGELGLTDIAPPLAYAAAGDVLLQARAKSDPAGQRGMWQCQLAQRQCSPLDDFPVPAALSVHPLTGELFVADTATGKLAKLSANGQLRAGTERPTAENPVLRLDSGLLFVNGSEGPAISVLRYEDQAFGQQLDEVLLLPPAALEAEQTRVWDFASSGSHWWVTLYNPGSGDSGLYLFDSDWSFIRELPRGGIESPAHLVNWGNKVLLFDPEQAQLQRYSGSGNPEVPLTSEALQGLIERQDTRRQWQDLGWSLALALSAVVALVGFGWAYLQSSRALVYKGRPTRGATPLDDIADDIEWISAAAARNQQLKHANVAFGVLSVAVVILLIGLGVSLGTLLAAMLALCGPIIALQMLLRSQREYLGVWDQHLVLVDHRQLYHLASGARIQYRGPFLLVDDVVVFTGTALLPAMDRAAVKQQVLPRSRAGVRVDRKTVLVKMLESHHPLARAGQVVMLCIGGGLLVAGLAQLQW